MRDALPDAHVRVVAHGQRHVTFASPSILPTATQHRRRVQMQRFNARTAICLTALSILSLACAHSPSQTNVATPAPQPGAASGTVSQAEIARQPNETVDKYLNGRFPGVTVAPSPDGGVTIRIRGATSVHGNNEPLYILDGVV